MCNRWDSEQDERREATAQARLDALMDWLINRVGCDFPVKIGQEASEHLLEAETPELRWTLEQLAAKPRFSYSVSLGWDSLRRYVDVVERFLATSLEDEVAQAEKLKVEVPDEYLVDLYDDLSLIQWQFSELFPQVFRYSLFVTCFTWFEHNLERLCKGYKRRAKPSLVLAEISGRGIDKYKTYLKKVVGIEKFPDNDDTWRNVRACQRIRNIIVHQNGWVRSDFGEGSEKAVESYICGHSSISLSENMHDEQRRIQLENGFCLEFIDTLENFFRSLYRVLP